MKTTLFEICPIFVRKEKRTKGHVFISMLVLKIARLIRNNLQNVFGSTDEDVEVVAADDVGDGEVAVVLEGGVDGGEGLGQ